MDDCYDTNQKRVCTKKGSWFDEFPLESVLVDEAEAEATPGWAWRLCHTHHCYCYDSCVLA